MSNYTSTYDPKHPKHKMGSLASEEDYTIPARKVMDMYLEHHRKSEEERQYALQAKEVIKQAERYCWLRSNATCTQMNILARCNGTNFDDRVDAFMKGD